MRFNKAIKLSIMFSLLIFSSFVVVWDVNGITNEKTILSNKMVDDIKKTVVFIGKIGGTVPDLAFLKIKDIDDLKAGTIFNELVRKGYLDENGRISSKFEFYKEGFSLDLNKNFKEYEKEIFDILLDYMQPDYGATGVLIKVQNIFHLITAKHVVANMRTGELNDDEMLIFLNSKNGNRSIHSIKDMKKKFNVNWIFHEDQAVDIAIIPFGLAILKDDFMVVGDNLFLSSDRIFELYDIFFLSYQPGIETRERISPVIRNGTISMINADKTFYIDGFAFPGNSGSPVFLKPSMIRFDEGDLPIAKDSLGGRFIGIIGSYVPYEEVAISTQTGRPRVIFEENTGLSKVWSVDYINEIVNSDVFKKQLEELQNKK